ncbi:tetratricopeptide repeat-containing sensor histidine kinase [Pedobacter frigidisoli]|uniref:tetratricopeptide repeat-containing sensor histidine kinase n=1 Tax=Pedobacter frigidisoli TaxID=2530455 RepID=UPI002930E7B7|nr:tetratricopeptide repeat-containing sensor histidine kinase [Pedobacter frigidisoli]
MKCLFLGCSVTSLLLSDRRYFLLLLIVFSFKVSLAQQRYAVSQAKLDSALRLDKKYLKRDSVKLKILETIYRQYLGLKKRDAADLYIDKVIELAHEKKLNKFSAYAFYRRALGYHGRSNVLKAEENYNKALADFSATGNLDMVGGIYLNLGALYSSIPDYVKSLEVNQKAIAIYEKLGNEEDMASCYTNVSSVYQNMGDQSQAVYYLNKALRVFQKDGDNPRGVSVVYEAIGTNYFHASDKELAEMNIVPAQKNKLALDYFTKALRVAEDINDQGLIATCKSDIGDLYRSLGKKEDAFKAYKQSVAINKDREDQQAYASSLYALGDFYQEENDTNNAVKLLAESLRIAEDNSLLDNEKLAALSLSHVYEKLKDYNRSLIYFRQYVTVRDKIVDQDKKREIIKRQLELDFSVKENDYLMRQRISESELKRQKQQLELRRQQLVLADKEKALDLLSFQKAKLALDLQHLAQENKLQKETNQARLAASEKDKKILSQNQQIKIDWKIKVFLTTAATLIFIIALLIYLSQRKTNRLNKIINNQKRELEQLSKVKDRIFSVVSHDMRTPVNSLIAFIQLLEEGDIERENLRRYAATLKNTLSYTSSMMENLLNWAASQMQGFNPYLEQLDLHELTTEVSNTLLATANDKNISLVNAVPQHTFCKADLNMLALVIRNLITNAIKFTPNGGVVEISVQNVARQIKLKIADTGIGLTEEQIAHFNKPGYLSAGVSTPGTNKEKGTGLGLLLCRTFVGLMEGKVSAHLNDGVGSNFVIELKK